MGGLKDQDTSISSTEPTKKKRGNPNLKKGTQNFQARNPGEETTQQKQNTMAEETTNTSEETTTNTHNEDPGNKKIIPEDTFSDEIVDKEVIPLAEEPRSKDYANINDPANPNTNATDPANPNAGPTSGLGTPVDTVNAGHGTPPPPGAIDQQLKAAEEARTKAEQAVKMGLSLYGKLHGVARHVAKVSESELTKMHASGTININQPLSLGNGSTTLGGFVQELNNEIDENVVVDQKFIDEITPPLTRIAIKNNWGLSDEWFVGAILLEDISTKAAVLFTMKSTCNDMLDHCKKLLKEQKLANTRGNNGENKEDKANVVRNVDDKDFWDNVPSADEIKE